MKRGLWLLVAAALLLGGMSGCARQPRDLVNVISREDGSGTRGAFVELLDIQGLDETGQKVDSTTLEAVITNSTSVMLTLVAGDKNAVGYVSLGSLAETVKALAIDGVSPTIESVKQGAYPVARPFNIVTGASLTPLAQDFIRFILSAEGQTVVEENGYVSAVQGQAFSPASPQPQGRIVVSGSSSVTPVMEKLAEAYRKLNPGAALEVQQSDSTTGINTVAAGICDIGMASRSLKESEIQRGLTATVIALDGIAVIVHKDNPLTQLTAQQAADLFRGNILFWSQLKQQ
ncbi:MAG: substrate-binding domain-containing protein [Oscillospiraceae bacterium]|jgi:phosphate transport system substrate-binding protein